MNFAMPPCPPMDEPKKVVEWSPQQAAGIEKARRWLDSNPARTSAYFLLGGYAGTGKSTIADALASHVTGGPVYYAAFTGKAANVLRQKTGSSNVGTVHSLAYRPKQRSDLRLGLLEKQMTDLRAAKPVDPEKEAALSKEIETERENLKRPSFQLATDSPLFSAGLLVLDEYSMIDKQIGEDLLRFGCRILALGDPGQLPPPRSAAYFTRQPDVLLTEIHRQAKDNPIIQLSMIVREGGFLRPGNYGESRVVDYAQLSKAQLRDVIMGADQLLVGKNTTRRSSNARIRQLLGYTSPMPVKGDKLVCLRNNADSGLFNGQLWRVTGEVSWDSEAEEVSFTAEPEDGGTEKFITAHDHYFLGREPDMYAVREKDCFDFGYALTVHKFQGSQSPNVVLLDEWNGNNRREWLYTGITRAQEKITVVKM